jgi:NADPH:quinone reductase-like Zn-dependent oxidoreductase
MPRIIRLHAFGGLENLRLDDVPSQEPGPGEVRLKVEASSVTGDHSRFMSGRQFRGHGFVQPSLPSRLGYESAGVIDRVGEGVDATWVGKRVSTIVGFDESRYGTLGEEAIVPAANVHEHPSNLTRTEAASFWVPYLTSYGGLVCIAQIQRGDFVSISAGSSSVGLAAIQFVRDAGPLRLLSFARLPRRKN